MGAAGRRGRETNGGISGSRESGTASCKPLGATSCRACAVCRLTLPRSLRKPKKESCSAPRVCASVSCLVAGAQPETESRCLGYGDERDASLVEIRVRNAEPRPPIRDL